MWQALMFYLRLTYEKYLQEFSQADSMNWITLYLRLIWEFDQASSRRYFPFNQLAWSPWNLFKLIEKLNITQAQSYENYSTSSLPCTLMSHFFMSTISNLFILPISSRIVQTEWAFSYLGLISNESKNLTWTVHVVSLGVLSQTDLQKVLTGIFSSWFHEFR